MTLTEQLREEKRKLFGITYVPKQEKAIGEVPDIMRKYIPKRNTFKSNPETAVNIITQWLANHEQVDIEDIYSNKRYRNLADARHKLFFLLYFTLPITQTFIAEKFNKHPSSVVHSIIKVKTLFVNSLDFQAFIKQFDSFYLDRVA
jgi:chromosomal replication initiation ATPase DnaA